MNLRERLKSKVLIADGAMGTLLYQFGVGHNYEVLNISNPDDIYNIHKAYIESGCNIIQTNTYAANKFKLSRYGLENKKNEINTKAVEIAKKAVLDNDVYILGSIGGIHNPGDFTLNEVNISDIVDDLTNQAKILINSGVDGILLETFYDFEELKAVLKSIRKLSDIVIVCNVTMQSEGILSNGIKLYDAFVELRDLGADVAGANCYFGPHHMLKSFKDLRSIDNLLLSVYPNASMLGRIDGSLGYENSSKYFGSFIERYRNLGISIIGGCCGTTPKHIEELVKNIKSYDRVIIKDTFKKTFKSNIVKIKSLDTTRIDDKVKNNFTVICEVAPPKTLKTNKFFATVEKLLDVKVDKVTLSDNSLAQPRISNLVLANLILNKFNHTPIVHLTTRDHNLLGLTSQIMGMHLLRLFDILAITGDPAKIGDFPGASFVNDLSSKELIEFIKKFNIGQNYTGKNLNEKSDFKVGVACNPNYNNLLTTAKQMLLKEKKGADYIVTQPFFNKNKIKDFYLSLKEVGVSIPVFIGVQPIVSRRNAEFLHNEIPGIKLTDEILYKLRKAEEENNERETGIIIAKDIIDEIKKYFKGIYLITPFLLTDLIVELVEYSKN